LFGFRLSLELLQAECPEALEELAQLFQSLGAGAVEAPGSFPTLGHEAGLLQYAQVLRDRRAADVEALCDLARRQLVVADELEDLAAAGFRECLNRRLHATDRNSTLT
jgi:hypothetical protein